jgi:hypothetical protein
MREDELESSMNLSNPRGFLRICGYLVLIVGFISPGVVLAGQSSAMPAVNNPAQPVQEAANSTQAAPDC